MSCYIILFFFQGIKQEKHSLTFIDIYFLCSDSSTGSKLPCSAISLQFLEVHLTLQEDLLGTHVLSFCSSEKTYLTFFHER